MFILLCLIGGTLYLLSIMPRMIGRPDYKPFMGFYYAHRGLHNNAAEAPENSMAAFQKAIQQGYGIEMDVQLTKDEVPVVFHDNTLERVCHMPGKVGDYTYEELQRFPLGQSQEKIPSFAEVLKQIDGQVPLIIELKIQGMDLKVCHLADHLLKQYSGVYCIESFHPLAVFWYRIHHKEIVRGQLSAHYGIQPDFIQQVLFFIMQNLMFNFLTKPDFIAYDHNYAKSVSRRVCRRLYHCLSVAWTIKSQEQLEENREQFDLFIFDSCLPDKREENCHL